MLEAVWAKLVKSYKYIFPDYHCPTCGDNLRKSYPAIESDNFFYRVLFGRTWVWTIAAVLFFDLLLKFLGFFIAILVLAACYFYFFHFEKSVRDKTNFVCESCDKEFPYAVYKFRNQAKLSPISPN